MSDLLAALVIGGSLALAFNPLVALVGSVAAACILTRRGARRAFAGWSVLIAAWLVGDGLRVLARARDLVDGAGTLLPGPEWTSWVALVVWGAGGLALGYVAPALAGAFVGRRVTWGTGWLAAGATAVAVSLALATIVAGLR